MRTIRCFYTCASCHLRRQFVEVPERDPVTHSVTDWMKKVAVPALMADHAAKSPFCRPREFAEVGIPVDEGTEHVGVKTVS